MTGPLETLINLANGYSTAPSAAGWMTRAEGEGTWGMGASCARCWKPLPPAELSKSQCQENCQCGDLEGLTTLGEVLAAHGLEELAAHGLEELAAHGLEELAGQMRFRPVQDLAVRVG